jgi:hypothetical protein
MQTVIAKDEGIVLFPRDFDAVGVANAEPALRYLGDLVSVALNLVFVVNDVPLRLHVRAVLSAAQSSAP